MKRVLLCAALLASPLHAQSAGKTGAQVLQFNAGARAGALSGAYTAALGDADVMFYNPAGIAGGRRGASVGLEKFSSDVMFGSIAGYTQLNGFAVGASIAYLDAGDIAEVVPDADFNGSLGTPTGARLSASESVARLSTALNAGAFRLGASVGLVSSAIAEVNEHAAFADVGAQYDVASITLSASLRNLGGKLSGPSKDPLPAELRVGAAVPFGMSSGIGVTAFADVISRLNESSLAFAAGIEAGLIPHAPSDIGVVARIGYDGESNGLAPLHFGAGVKLRALSIDYAYQNLDFIGAVHRLGVRWYMPAVKL